MLMADFKLSTSRNTHGLLVFPEDSFLVLSMWYIGYQMYFFGMGTACTVAFCLVLCAGRDWY